MEFGLNAIAWLAALPAIIPMWVVIVEIASALRHGNKSACHDEADGMFPDTVVLIPAHNEEAVLGSTLESIYEDLPSKCRVLCVAHNCSDATADIARKAGAEAIEVRDEGAGGKPDALKAGLRWLDKNPPEVVVVVDADCTVSAGAIRALAVQARRLGHPVMGAYFFAAPAGGRQAASVSSLAILLKNFIRPLGLHRLGLTCLLNGSGSAYPFHIIREAPHGEGSIAEDYQLAIDFLRMGHPTTFVPDARVDGQLPAREQTARKQRRRWEHGHLYLSFRVAPRLLLEGLMRLDKNRMALALELAVPPLSFLGLMWFGAAGLSLVAFPLSGGGPLGMLVFSAAAFVLAVLAAWARFAGAGQTAAALAAAPGYLLWKLPIYRDFFIRRETRWMKTGRD